MQGLLPLQNGQFPSKNKKAKNMRKTILQYYYGSSAQKTAREKKNKYSRNETILKLGHLSKDIAHARAVVFAKWSVWVKN